MKKIYENLCIGIQYSIQFLCRLNQWISYKNRDEEKIIYQSSDSIHGIFSMKNTDWLTDSLLNCIINLEIIIIQTSSFRIQFWKNFFHLCTIINLDKIPIEYIRLFIHFLSIQMILHICFELIRSIFSLTWILNNNNKYQNKNANE